MEVLGDVTKVKRWLRQFFDSDDTFKECVTQFVGRDDTSSLTKTRFLNMVERMFEKPGKVFVLYYAGHGTDDKKNPGAFCVKGEECYVTLDDLINCWLGPRAHRGRRGKKFIIVADSCHSGHLVEQLKKEDKKRGKGFKLNMGIQAACAPDEVSWDGLFTRLFFDAQDPGFDWEKAEGKIKISQHPDFFTTWGTDTARLRGGSYFQFHRIEQDNKRQTIGDYSRLFLTTKKRTETAASTRRSLSPSSSDEDSDDEDEI
jgi:hypothetical protein